MINAIKNIVKKYSNYIIIIISILTTLSLSMNMLKDIKIMNSFNGNSVLYVGIFILLVNVLKKVFQINDKRMIICTSIISIIFSMFEIVGFSINNYMDLSGIFESYNTIFKAIFSMFGYFVVIFSSLMLLFNYLNNKISGLNNKVATKQSKFLKTNKASFFIVWGIIFVAWIPYFLKYYPGLTTSDSINQIYQAIGVTQISNHHPIMHTLIISICMHIGNNLLNYNFGLAIYSIVQMLIMSAIFSFSIYYMAKKELPKYIIIIATIFYAFYPVNGLFSIIMWKDVIFAGLILLFTICISELYFSEEKFLKSRLKKLLFILSIFLVIMFRNNGLYVVILILPFILLSYKNHWKKLLLIFIIPIIIASIIKGPIYSSLNIKEGQVREALSIPMQQLARVTKNKEDRLTQTEKNSIRRFIQTDNIAHLYNPILSDPIKNHFNSEEFSENKVEFLKLWVELFFKYPVEYIESFMCNSYGYWYPEATNWVANRTMEPNDLGLYDDGIINGKIVEKIDSLIERRNIPIISMLFSIGFTFWMIIVFLIYCIYKKDYKKILIYLPVLILWLTTLASPVFCEFRYVYSMFTCIPILIVINFRSNKGEIKNGKNRSINTML